MRFRAWIVWVVGMAALGFAASGCDDACEPGEPCECVGGDECFLECDGDGCQQACRSMVRCAGHCDDHCSFDCHDMTDCSASCGDDCVIDCRSMATCQAECGARCDYACSNGDGCRVRVGPASTVDCRSVGSCQVDCAGSCQVLCQNIGGECDVRCADGAEPRDCGGGRLGCEACGAS